ncbi:hypothetical protein AUEXF2481DRAFT_148400 [Aureobasidium subglaciale EXF-2481]|uniref:Protein root UVB sensitive/RUS domain-containing protein n=1 Tax=Aureobasidium subglaciale (strain EXF-2481) TaxID=1043005 RepID=A0A074YSH5_AURSE|nr:uncharacterized protein AUEXF2481DRAFT_148400 [Aureobasidium subglaciale EXF-2481]KER00616.1 hypothetical protein AUEXF2481DRAFT_148400 [Aureobasidium subglaciale EXF-2481]
MSKPILELIEMNEAGIVTATYVQTSTAKRDVSRIDRIEPESTQKSLKALLDVFLPAGYPHSVSEDYLPYQIYDSLQAFSSSIAGLLASRAVLEGVGVGDASASATSALLLSILQESMGRAATILFAHRLGTSLEPECKMYRLLADVFNDAAMVLDCLSPAFPKPMRVLILASSSILRSLCGVAAGSSKASLSAHFARWGNLGELNAVSFIEDYKYIEKDSSQETVISLIGMLVGCLVVKAVNTPLATWTTLLLLLALHLATNYMAVRSVCMRTLNRQRANIVFACLHKHDRVLSPEQVSDKERIFERDGILRDADDKCLGYCRIGVPASELLMHLGKTDKLTKATNLADGRLLQLLGLFEEEGYVIYLEHASNMACILLKKGSNTAVQLKAWYHVLLLARLAGQGCKAEEAPMDMVKSTLVAVRKDWDKVQARLGEAGWDLETAALETTSGSRVCIQR